MAFAKEERRGKKRIPTLGVACPVCGQGKVAENSKGFYCTRFREGCRFTIWKDALTRAGGPMLTAKLLKQMMDGDYRVSPHAQEVRQRWGMGERPQTRLSSKCPELRDLLLRLKAEGR